MMINVNQITVKTVITTFTIIVLLKIGTSSANNYCTKDQTRSFEDKVGIDCRNLKLTKVPDYLFSFIFSLDLSHNIIDEFNLTGISKGFPNLTGLYLEDNLLKKVPLEIREMSNLQILYLNNNTIGEVTSGDFSNLSELINLRLNDNQITKIPDFIFANNTKLEEMSLANNRISELGKNAFHGLGHLTWLELKNNRLVDFSHNMWKPLLSLEVLGIQNNTLESLDFTMFCPLKNLIEIWLADNSELKTVYSSIESLRDPECLLNLTYLSLENCDIESTPSGTFAPFNDIRHLLMNGNPSSKFCTNFNATYHFNDTNAHYLRMTMTDFGFPFANPAEIIELCDMPLLNTLKIEYSPFQGEVRFSGSCLNQVETFVLDLAYGFKEDECSNLPAQFDSIAFDRNLFKGMDHLKVLYIPDNNLDEEFLYSFADDLSQLISLYFSDNIAASLDSPFGSSPADLEYLDLSRNIIESISSTFFTNMPNLKMLFLDDNSIKKTSSAFSNLQNLIVLDISENKILSVEKDSFDGLTNLTEVDISENKIMSIDKNSFDGLTKLCYLNLAKNDISRLPKETFERLSVLQVLDLSHNDLAEIEEPLLLSTLLSLVPYIYIDLSYSELVLKDTQPFVCFRNQTIYLDMAGNDLGSTLYEANFYNILLSSTSLLIKDNNLEFPIKLTASSDITQHLDISLNRIPSFEINGLFPNLSMINISFNLIEKFVIASPLPSLSEIHLQNNLDLYSTGISIGYPLTGLKLCDLSHNNIEVITATIETRSILINLTNITVLDLSGNWIDLPEHWKKSDLHAIFEEITSLTSLSIASCKIKQDQLQGKFFAKLIALEELNLSDNKIVSCDPGVFGSMVSLKKLDLSGNSITKVDAETFSKMSQIIDLQLGKGTFTCNCEMKAFQRWMLDHLNSVKFTVDGAIWDNYICSSEYFEGQPLLVVDFTDFCEADLNDYEWYVIQTTTITLGVFVSLLVVITLLVRHYYWTIRYLFYRCRMRKRKYAQFEENQEMQAGEPQEQMKYDVFVSYTRADFWWIYENLLPHLEEMEPRLAVCIHDRDFMVGKAIVDNIEDSIKNSKKVLFVITKEFIDSHWCMFEVYLALQMLLNQHKEKIIFVILEKIPAGTIPSILKLLLNTKTYVEWPGKEDNANVEKFWKRLRLALYSNKEEFQLAEAEEV